ncbi:MAG TPA: adenosine deaminase [Bacteroidota bacterium]|nr:adenosine deaminase [Bacteroidota bacterium]
MFSAHVLPKVELHLHLDCSLSYEVVARIDPTVTRSDFERDFIAPAKCTNLADYLTRARHGIAMMQTEQELRWVTADLFEQLRKDNILYAEIRFAPLLHTQKGLTPEQVVEIIDSEATRASMASGVEARLILCTLRHFTNEQSMETVMLVRRFRGKLVAALDIAGDEAGYPVNAHIPAFRHAMTNNVPRTAHAGEALGATSVWETLKHFQPTRIGHGVRSIEDAGLIEHLKQTRIHLEICPTSNVQTDVIGAIGDHPANRLYSAGVSVGINTDARTISNVTLATEYEVLHRQFGWSTEHFRTCNMNALEAAFLPEKTKRQLADRLLLAYQGLEGSASH